MSYISIKFSEDGCSTFGGANVETRDIDTGAVMAGQTYTAILRFKFKTQIDLYYYASIMSVAAKMSLARKLLFKCLITNGRWATMILRYSTSFGERVSDLW